MGGSIGCLSRNNETVCWGMDRRGPGAQVTDPIPVLGVGAADELAVTAGLACGLFGDRAACWHSLARGGDDPDYTPEWFVPAYRPVELPARVAHIEAGWGAVCTRGPDGSVSVWEPSLGAAGALEMRRRAVAGMPCDGRIDAWPARGCDFGASETTCWNYRDPIRTYGIGGVVRARWGVRPCFLTSGGSVVCDGNVRCGLESSGAGCDADGELVRFEFPRPVTDIAIGVNHACALLANDDVWCWGANGHGELGDGTSAPHDSPVRLVPPPAALEP